MHHTPQEPIVPPAPYVGGLPPAPSAPPAGSRPLSASVGMHLAGAMLTSIALVGGFVGLILIAIAALHCGPEPAHLARDLKLWTALLGAGVALVPGLWALLCRRHQYAWGVWVAIAGIVILITVWAAADIAPRYGTLFGPCSS